MLTYIWLKNISHSNLAQIWKLKILKIISLILLNLFVSVYAARLIHWYKREKIVKTKILFF